MRTYYAIKIEDKGIGARVNVGTETVALSYNLKHVDYRNEFNECFANLCNSFANMTKTKRAELRAAFANAIRKAKGWSFDGTKIDLSGVVAY